MNADLQELLHKFDGVDGGNTRLAWYGQCRAEGKTHEEAIIDTYNRYRLWCYEVWPRRNIPFIPTSTSC